MSPPGDAAPRRHAVANLVACRDERVGVHECACERRGGVCMFRWLRGMTLPLVDMQHVRGVQRQICCLSRCGGGCACEAGEKRGGRREYR